MACTISALAVSTAAGAQAQDWHMTELNDRPAGLPDHDKLSFQGLIGEYAPHVRFVIQCTNPESRDVHEAFESDWFPLDYQQSTPSFECPPERPELVQAWCAMTVWW